MSPELQLAYPLPRESMAHSVARVTKDGGRVKVRLRFSLRRLLLASAVIAVATAWFAVEYLQRYRREAAVLNHLTAIGCDVQLAPRPPRAFWKWFGDGIALQASSLDLSHMPAGDAELAQIAGLSGLQGLYLDGTNVTDRGAAHLAGCTNLLALNLRNTAVQKSPPVNDMGKLLHLDLSNTAISDINARGLQSLEYLGLAGTRIHDDALVGLAPLPNLQTLDLSRNVNVSDRGIEHLTRSRLPKLTRIYVWQTSVTDGGASALAAEFPGAAVIHTAETRPTLDPATPRAARGAATKGR
jgi:hypothetical protein